MNLRAVVNLALRLHVLPSAIYAMSEWDFLLCLAALKLDHEAQQQQMKRKSPHSDYMEDGFDG